MHRKYVLMLYSPRLVHGFYVLESVLRREKSLCTWSRRNDRGLETMLLFIDNE